MASLSKDRGWHPIRKEEGGRVKPGLCATVLNTEVPTEVGCIESECEIGFIESESLKRNWTNALS